MDPFILQARGTVRKHLASITALVEHKVLWLFDKADHATEVSLDTREMAVIRTVLNWAVALAFQTSVFLTAVKRAVHQWLAKPLVVNDVVVHIFDALLLIFSVAKFVKNEVHERFLKKAEEEQHWDLSNKAIVNLNDKAENELLVY